VDLAEIDRSLAELGVVPDDCAPLIARYAGAARLSVSAADRALAALAEIAAEPPLPQLSAAEGERSEATASSESGERLVPLPPSAARTNGHDPDSAAASAPNRSGLDSHAWARPEATERTAAVPSDAPASPDEAELAEDADWSAEQVFEVEVSGLLDDAVGFAEPPQPSAAEVSRPLHPSEVLEAWRPSHEVASPGDWESNQGADALDSWQPDQQLSAAGSRAPSGRPTSVRLAPLDQPNDGAEQPAEASDARPSAGFDALRSSRPVAVDWQSGSQPLAADFEHANAESDDPPAPAWPLPPLHSSGGSSEFKSGLLTQRMDVRELRSTPPAAGRSTPLPGYGAEINGLDELPAFRGAQSGVSNRPAPRPPELPPIPLRSQRPAAPAPEDEVEILVDDELLEVDPNDLLEEGGD
jgi:hypothetical protein